VGEFVGFVVGFFAFITVLNLRYKNMKTQERGEN
jgi:hypothetical protein